MVVLLVQNSGSRAFPHANVGFSPLATLTMRIETWFFWDAPADLPDKKNSAHLLFVK